MNRKQLFIITILIFSSSVFAYTPTAYDQSILSSLQPRIETLRDTNPWRLSVIASKIEQALSLFKPQTQWRYILTQLAMMIADNLCIVTTVIDWDTLDMMCWWEEFRIRLIWIDAPERGERYADKATEYVEQRVLFKNAFVETDESQGLNDRYGRYLGYVFVEWEDVWKELITSGLAREYTYADPYKYREQYREAAQIAQEAWIWIYSSPNKGTTSSYQCGTKKYCGEMSSCEEAYYYLEKCELSRLDWNSDGVPCERLCTGQSLYDS